MTIPGSEPFFAMPPLVDTRDIVCHQLGLMVATQSTTLVMTFGCLAQLIFSGVRAKPGVGNSTCTLRLVLIVILGLTSNCGNPCCNAGNVVDQLMTVSPMLVRHFCILAIKPWSLVTAYCGLMPLCIVCCIALQGSASCSPSYILLYQLCTSWSKTATV